MFRKCIKKEFPSGTFIPTPARVVAILQLCLAFSLLLWQASEPFMGDLFRIKSHMLSYQNLMGLDIFNDATPEHKALLNRNAERFANLPKTLQGTLKDHYTSFKGQLNDPFSQKIKRLISLFLVEISLFELAWVFFSIVISVMLLKRIEGARHAAWLLPVLALFFLFDNRINGIPVLENHLFPSEHEIVKHYLQEPLSTDILKQHEQLLQGWNLYLIKEWGKEKPHKDPAIFQLQVETGEFMFNVNYLNSMKPREYHSQQKVSLFLLFIYVVWNLFFAWFVNLHLQAEEQEKSNKPFIKTRLTPP